MLALYRIVDMYNAIQIPTAFYFFLDLRGSVLKYSSDVMAFWLNGRKDLNQK